MNELANKKKHPERDGLIQRIADPDDRRATLLQLTEDALNWKRQKKLYISGIGRMN